MVTRTTPPWRFWIWRQMNGRLRVRSLDHDIMLVLLLWMGMLLLLLLCFFFFENWCKSLLNICYCTCLFIIYPSLQKYLRMRWMERSHSCQSRWCLFYRSRHVVSCLVSTYTYNDSIGSGQFPTQINPELVFQSKQRFGWISRLTDSLHANKLGIVFGGWSRRTSRGVIAVDVINWRRT